VKSSAQTLTRILHENANKHGEDLDAENVANTADGNKKLPSDDFATSLCAIDSSDSSGLHAISGLSKRLDSKVKGSPDPALALSRIKTLKNGLSQR